MVTGKLDKKIEYYPNIFATWDWMASIFKPQLVGYFNDALIFLDYFTLKDCKNSMDQITKFRVLVNKLCSFLSEFKIDDNFFIYKFKSNLGINHTSYFKRYAQDFNLFNEDRKCKYSLSLAIQHFWNTVKNPSIKSHISLKIVAMVLLSHLYTSYLFSNTTQRILTIFFKSTAPNQKITEVT